MEKVSISLTPEQLNAMLASLNEIPYTIGDTPAQRAVQSIFDELLSKLLKKQIDKRNEPQNKAFKLKLKHHEAFALSEMLLQVRELLPAHFIFEKNAILKINFQISEQL
ncbi:hypothetical protein [Ornithobacterium rhinotracheale]|uniref:hypothetical protein n=1 Tax=Ornithobacterium rhinotracheale TaxID=28251 RepID=UPI001FF526B7|nr:hypothetical protein [Ornithobacterium rhinotracheale]MCK0206200.1 hypothetical protein [Ornithobacterium rhinotracheale]